MAEGTGRLWLAATIFDEPDRMGRALWDLQACQVGLGALCVIGTRTAVGTMHGGLCRLDPQWLRFSPLFADVERVPFIDADRDVIATADRLMTNGDAHAAQQRKDDASVHRKCWLPETQRTRLAEGIATGGVVVMANPVSREQWAATTRALLQHSTHSVQSYEFPMAMPSSSRGRSEQ